MTRRPKSSRVQDDLPSREEILAFIAESPGKVGKREISRAFNIKGAARIGLKRMLRDMAEAGEIEGRRRDLRRPGDLPSVTIIKVSGIDDDGELTATPLEWNEEWGAAPRITIAPPDKRKKRSQPAPGIGDRVLARLSASTEPDEFSARIIKILPSRQRTGIGIYRDRSDGGWIIPVNRKARELPVEKGQANDITDGELVSIEVTKAGRHGAPVARIVERIGDVSNESAISLIALEEHGIPYRFADDVLAEAESATPVGSPRGKDWREDWRDLPLITIDPADARDHDDAVHASPDPDNPGGIIVTVAIADVAAYVEDGSAMDRHARLRGNSVYFPGRVVPMLPERISNDLCSLREGEDRPAIAVRMRFDKNGRKISHRFHRIIMRSALKLAYEDAQAAADGKADHLPDDQRLIINELWSAYAILTKGRVAREPLEIEIPERKVLLNTDGGVERIVVPPRLEAHKLIEEFMIQANVSAAETLEERGVPTVYRIHDEPSFEKLEALRDFLGSLDMNLAKSGGLRPSQFNSILRRVRGTPHAVLVNEVILRSQSQAEYSIQNIGHFGLNLRRYAHFTSPIRRYADLLIHRALIATLNLGPGGSVSDDLARLERISGEISVCERRAMNAERDTRDRLIALWLADRVGALFDGHVRGVTRAGLFVELDDTGADGFVPISTLGTDYFDFEETHHRLVGRSTGEVFQLGMAVEVRLVEALPFAGSLRFEMMSKGQMVAKPTASRMARTSRKQKRKKRLRTKGPA